MCTNSSANAPEFFLHHAFIDKIWANWQEYSERHRTVHFSRLNISMIGTNYRPRDFMDTIELPDIERLRTGRRTCVLYQDPTRPEYSEIMDRLAGIFTDMSIYDYMTTQTTSMMVSSYMPLFTEDVQLANENGMHEEVRNLAQPFK